MGELAQVRRHYEEALDGLVGVLQTDPTVVAAVVWGSYAYDEVWERSDIDMTIVRDDRKARSGSSAVALNASGVNVHAHVVTRAEFRKQLQSSVMGWAQQMTLGRILFTRDESLRAIFEEVQAVGDRDRRLRLLELASGLTTITDKVEKWLRVKQDAHYATVWLCGAAQRLADIEVVRHMQVPRRESLQQATPLNPGLFGSVYTGLLEGPKTVEAVDAVLQRVYGYLTEHLEELFGPLLDYLQQEATIRSVSDIVQHFARRLDARMIIAACEWLEGRGVLVKASAPHFLTQHSRVEYEELAFVLPGGRR